MNALLRIAALSALVAGVAGCNSLTATSLETMKLAIKGPAPQISAARIDAIDSPTLLAEFGVAQALFTSHTDAVGQVQWLGRTEVLVTHHGRLVKTAGLPADFISPLLADDPFANGLHLVQDGQRIHRIVDYPSRYQTGLEQQATYKRGPMEDVEIRGQTLRLQRIDERIWMPELKYRAVNRYWVDNQSGFVHKSAQHVAPQLPVIYLTVLQSHGGRP